MLIVFGLFFMLKRKQTSEVLFDKLINCIASFNNCAVVDVHEHQRMFSFSPIVDLNSVLCLLTVEQACSDL